MQRMGYKVGAAQRNGSRDPALPRETLRQSCTEFAEEAAREIMRIYAGDLGVRNKADKSPVTDADNAAEAIIVKGLRALTPDTPVVAEEEMAAGRVPMLKNGGPFWLVDPLDGTKEFIKRNGEFTVNIALIEDGKPALGIVLAPASGTLWRGIVGEGRRQARRRWSLRADPYAAGASQRPHRLRQPQPRDLQRPRHLVPQQQPHRRRSRAGRLVAEVLPDRRGQGRHLPALRPDQRVGHRGGPCRARSGRRRSRDDRRSAARLRQADLRKSALHRPQQGRQVSIADAARLIREGELVAFPTETVYGLGGDATNERAVAKIFEAKGRPQFNPLISHVLDAGEARRLVQWNETADKLAARFWPGPLTLVLLRAKDSPIALLATAGLDTAAIRAPAHPMAQALIRAAGRPIAGPSANRSGAVSPTRAEHVAESLGNRVKLILDGGPCEVGLESTVLDLSTVDADACCGPAGATREAIEAVIGPIALSDAIPSGDSARKSPGQLASHYAPARPVRLNATEYCR